MLRRRVAAPSHKMCSSCVSVSFISQNWLSQSTVLHYLYHPPGSREPSLPWYNPSNNSNNSTNMNKQQQQVNLANSSLNVPSAPVYNPFASDSAAYQINTPIPPSSSSSPSSSFQTTELEELLRTSNNTSPSSALNESVKSASSPIMPPQTTTTTTTTATSPSSEAVNKENSKSTHAHTSTANAKTNTQHDRKQQPSSSSSSFNVSNTISLDTRIENIIKVEDNHISTEMLPKVVQLLIDPNAEKVENITLSEFASMQPRRQLMALNMQKAWHEWILSSSYYQQAARLASESPTQDLKALQQAGIYTLQQWMEQPNLINVSLRTRSALDSAIEESIQIHMNEVAMVVNTSLLLESQWNEWMSDVIGKFVLDALRISLPSASAALQARRQQYYNSVQRQQSKLQEPSNLSNKNDNNNNNVFNVQEANNSAAMLSAMMNNNTENIKEKMKNTNSISVNEDNNNSHLGNASPLLSLPAMYYDGPVLRPGEACTLEHYYRFVQKVLAGVRQDYRAANGNNEDMERDEEEESDFNMRGDLQSETEILERTYAIIATAMNQLLEQAAERNLPHELRALYTSGYVALDRIPGVLKRAMSHLQLRLLPVRHFVFHSTLDSAEFTPRTHINNINNNNVHRSHVHYASSAKQVMEGQANQNNNNSNKFANSSSDDPISSTNNSSSSPSSLSSPLDISAPVYASGTFLTGSSFPDVTLGEWCGTPIPPSSNENSTKDDSAQKEYFSLLHRLRRHVDKLSMTSMNALLSHSEEYGGNGFSACDALGLHQLFGPAKLVEDRLASILSFPLSSIEKPIHFIEAGYTSGKTALLERLQSRTKLHERAVLVRYNSSATPFIPDVDDHPLSFASRFWFRVALSSCPCWIRTELLFSRAPQSVMWWAHSKNWNWERVQSLLINGDKANRSIPNSSNYKGYHHLHGSARGNWRKLLQSKPFMYDVQNLITASQSQQLQNNYFNSLDQVDQLTAILVDDMDRVLDSMESKWAEISETAMLQQSALAAADAEAAHEQEEEEEEEEELEEEELSKNLQQQQESNNNEDNEDKNEELLEGGKMEHSKNNKNKQLSKNSTHKDKNEDQNTNTSSNNNKKIKHMVNSNGVLTLNLNSKAAPPVSLLNETHEQHQKRLHSLQQWSGATGKPLHEALQNTFTPLLTALGQLEFIFTGHRVSTHFVNMSHVPVRRYFIPVIGNGAGLQQRLRVLPLMSCLHALHLRAHLEFPGLLYEVLKNSPALAGKTLEVFWTNRISLMDLRTGNARLLQWDNSNSTNNSTSQLLLQSYLPHELYAELPLRNYLLQYPRWARLRLVELLQRQLSSPTGYLTTGIDTNSVDERIGLISPHNHTCAQVHPFALFTIFSHQEVLEGSSSNASNNNHHHLIGTSSSNSSSSNSNGLLLYHQSSPREKKVVRAWAEVWAEYKSVVANLATTPSRKRDALRVLLHGALLLRSAAVAGAQLDLNLKVPPFGFPLLSSEVRVKSKHTSSSSHYYYHPQQQSNYISASNSNNNNGLEVRSASVETVRKAIATYKSFFVNATQSHFPFRPVVGLNGGCDVVFISGSTLALYDLVTTSAELKEMTYRFAEALLGILHILERQVLPIDKIRSIQYTTVVSIDQMKPISTSSSLSVGHSTITMSNEAHSFASNSHNSTGSSSSKNNKMFSPLMDVFTANSSPVIPHLLDYSAVFEDSVMDRLEAVKEPLGISQVFRTLSELIDELEHHHHVKVQQDVISAQEEMEALLSPTLFQLVPDATVLPPYTSSVISAEDLMMEAMLSRDEDDDDENDVNVNVDGVNDNEIGVRAKLQDGEEEDINNVLIEEDMDAKHKSSNNNSTNRIINNKDDNHLVLQRSTSAEAEDAMSDVFYAREVEGSVAAAPRNASQKSTPQQQQQQIMRSNNSPMNNNAKSSSNVVFMDNDMAPESAALLEAMMNDRIDELTDARRKNAMAQAQMQEELRRDIMTENAINYNTPFSLAGNPINSSSNNTMNVKVDGNVHSPLSTSQGVVNTNSLMNNNNNANNNRSMLRRNADLETDSLAWLHDIISPEALLGTSAEMPVAGQPTQPEKTNQLSIENKNEENKAMSGDADAELNENEVEVDVDDDNDELEEGEDSEAADAEDEEIDETLEEEEEDEVNENDANEEIDGITMSSSNDDDHSTEIPTLEGLEDASTIFPRTVAKRGRRGLSSLTRKANTSSHKTRKPNTTTNNNEQITMIKNRKTRMARKQAARGLRASQGTATSSSAKAAAATRKNSNSSSNSSQNSAKRLLASLSATAKGKVGRGVSVSGTRGRSTKSKKPVTSNKSNASSTNAAKSKKQTAAAAALNKRRSGKK